MTATSASKHTMRMGAPAGAPIFVWRETMKYLTNEAALFFLQRPEDLDDWLLACLEEAWDMAK